MFTSYHIIKQKVRIITKNNVFQSRSFYVDNKISFFMVEIERATVCLFDVVFLHPCIEGHIDFSLSWLSLTVLS